MTTQKPDEARPRATTPARLAFPIVGIGASAGGFAALATLLQHLPASPGMALVIVLHLPPDQHSTADRILQHSTRLSVVQVDHATPILPDQVYLIPPGRGLTMEDGRLVPYDLGPSPGNPATIDRFFRALAMRQRERAIGVILSGIGADGAVGLACIKEQGGVALVQSPADAEHASMPQSAIDVGIADFVLGAAEIPARLMALRATMQPGRAHAPHGHAPAEPGVDPISDPVSDPVSDPAGTLQDVLALLYEHTGHDFRHYKRASLLQRLARRLQVRGQPDVPSYHALQRQDPAESQALFKDLLIGVTQFFRDRAAYAMLEHKVLPQIFKDKGPGDTVRVWVAACSTGEEAYSMAMLLADHAATLAAPPAIQVLASDIDAQAIRTARAGLYPASIAQDVTLERLQRYFTIENGSYKVRKALRRQVLFAEHNLLHDPAFSTLDLISCRNFLIYLDQRMHRRVFDMFHFALRPDGYLMLGSAETIDEACALFAAVDAGLRIYRKKPGARSTHVPDRAPVQEPAPALARPAGHAAAAPRERRARLFSFADIHLHKAAQQGPPSILVDAGGDIVHISAEASRFLRHAGGEPTRYLVSLVLPAWRLALRTALFQACKRGRETRTGTVHYEENGERRAIEMAALPFHDEHAEGLLMLVSFREILAMPEIAAAPALREQSLLEQFDEELRHTRNKLLDTMDQAEQSEAALRTTLEELKTTVEELQSANRQLDETLASAHAANEALGATNADLRQRLASLGKSHDDLNNLIASSDVATLFLDPLMRIERYTPRVTDMFNILPADLGRPLLHITSRLDNAHLAEDAARVFETLQPLEQEVSSKDGRVYIVRVHPYRSASHRIEGAVMSFFDITGRKEAEATLRESEVLLRTLLQSHAQAIWQSDAQGRVVADSPSWLAYTGQTGGECSGEGWADALHPDDRDMALQVWHSGIAAERVISNRFRLRSADGGWRWTNVLAAPVRNPDGTMRKWVGMNIDIDAEKQAEEALRANEARLTAVFDSMPLGVAMIDLAGTVTLCNAAYRRFVPGGRLPSCDPAVLALWRAFDRNGQVLAPQEFPGARALRGERVLPGQEMLYRDDTGSEIRTYVASVPLFDQASKVRGIISMISDIDDVKSRAGTLR